MTLIMLFSFLLKNEISFYLSVDQFPISLVFEFHNIYQFKIAYKNNDNTESFSSSQLRSKDTTPSEI